MCNTKPIPSRIPSAFPLDVETKKSNGFPCASVAIIVAWAMKGAVKDWGALYGRGFVG